MQHSPEDFVPQPARLLVRSVNWLGDVVMTLPALMRLREGCPDSELILLTPQKLAGLWEGQTFLDKIIPFPNKAGIFEVSKLIRETHPEVALIFPNSPRSAIESWLAGTPVRIGIRGRWRSFFLNSIVPDRPNILKMHKRTSAEVAHLLKTASPSTASGIYRPSLASHQIAHYLHLVSAVGASSEPLEPRLITPADEQSAVATRFGIALPAGTSPLLGVNAGAEYGYAKRWPLESFAETVVQLSKSKHARWILFGGPADVALAAELESRVVQQCPEIQIYNVAGKTSLRELTLLCSLCRLVLTNDTGPMHVAAAAGAIVAVPFGSTSPELTAPGSPGSNRHIFLKSSVPCAPCFLRECPIATLSPQHFQCMRSLAPQTMVAAITSRL